MREDLPTGTVTFLFTDVEGSTRLLHELGAETYAQSLAEHRRVVRESCAAEGGSEVDTQGDAFFFAFPSAVGAVAAAQAITDALASGRIHVRMGLHTGAPLVADEGYVGDDVHLAARVAASGHGGQVLLSQTTRELVDGLSLTDLGEHRLKDIEGAVSIYQLGWTSFPPLKTISNTNLPRPASSFVGRKRELSELLASFEQGARLLTLTGPGGSGKTRLAVEAATTLVPSYKAGVFWVGLASLRDPSLVTETIAQTLGARDDLSEHIAEREMLLVLDNLEQVIEAAPDLSTLLTACPNLTLLVTSRELLRVQGEVEYAVPPLASPEAVALFCERSRLQPSKEIAELCARLDDLPLAVELAAARTKALAPAHILDRLSKRLDMLRGGRDADPRQQTLGATIAWSYELLSEHEQGLFGAVSVFAGGCTLEAAEEVAGADLDTLQSLVEKSLLRFSGERYWMLETIREHARDRLEDGGEADAVRSAHARWCLGLAEAVGRELPRPLEASLECFQRWLPVIEADLDNLRAATRWSIEHGEREQALRIVNGLVCYWNRGGPYSIEGAHLLREALAAPGAVTDPTKAHAQELLGLWLLFTDRAAEAERPLEEALEIYRALGDTEEFETLRCLALVAQELGDLDRARALFEQARDLHYDDFQYLVNAGLGSVELEAGNLARARELLEEGLGQARMTGHLRTIGDLTMYLAETDLAEASFDRAEQRYLHALQIQRSYSFDANICMSLGGLAAASAGRRDLDRAGRLWGAVRVQHELGVRYDRSPHQRHSRLLDGHAEPRYRRGLEEGRTFSLDQAVAFALGEPADLAAGPPRH